MACFRGPRWQIQLRLSVSGPLKEVTASSSSAAAGNTRGWNGIQYKAGLSAKNVPARQLSMNVATIPPGGVAAAHIHVGFEVMLYILQGRVRHEFGPALEHAIENEAGDFIFIEPGVPHEVFNVERHASRSSPSSRGRTPASGSTSSRFSARADSGIGTYCDAADFVVPDTALAAPDARHRHQGRPAFFTRPMRFLPVLFTSYNA